GPAAARGRSTVRDERAPRLAEGPRPDRRLAVAAATRRAVHLPGRRGGAVRKRAARARGAFPPARRGEHRLHGRTRACAARRRGLLDDAVAVRALRSHADARPALW